MYTGNSTETNVAVSAGCNVVFLKGHKEYHALLIVPRCGFSCWIGTIVFLFVCLFNGGIGSSL